MDQKLPVLDEYVCQDPLFGNTVMLFRYTPLSDDPDVNDYIYVAEIDVNVLASDDEVDVIPGSWGKTLNYLLVIVRRYNSIVNSVTLFSHFGWVHRTYNPQ